MKLLVKVEFVDVGHVGSPVFSTRAHVRGRARESRQGGADNVAGGRASAGADRGQARSLGSEGK